MTWTLKPSIGQKGTVRVYFYNKDQGAAQQPVFEKPSVAQISILARNTHSESVAHEAKVTQAKTKEGSEFEGVYDASEVEFFGEGQTEITARFLDQDGKILEDVKLFDAFSVDSN